MNEQQQQLYETIIGRLYTQLYVADNNLQQLQQQNQELAQRVNALEQELKEGTNPINRTVLPVDEAIQKMQDQGIEIRRGDGPRPEKK